MDQQEFEKIMDRLDGVFEGVRRCRQAIEWLEDHSGDNHLGANLGMIRKELGRLEYSIHEIMGRPAHQALGLDTDEDVPFD